MVAFFITHPDVVVEPHAPISRWRLSDLGVTRMRAFVASPVVENVREVWASTETKAIEAAGLLAARFGIGVNVDDRLGENDRTATGFLPPEEFEVVADAFFAAPSESVRGWETAAHAQARVTEAFREILGRQKNVGDLAIVAHGAVGTLLLCAMLDRPISRELDQQFQGHFWTFDPVTWRVLQAWTPIAPR